MLVDVDKKQKNNKKNNVIKALPSAKRSSEFSFMRIDEADLNMTFTSFSISDKFKSIEYKFN